MSVSPFLMTSMTPLYIHVVTPSTLTLSQRPTVSWSSARDRDGDRESESVKGSNTCQQYKVSESDKERVCVSESGSRVWENWGSVRERARERELERVRVTESMILSLLVRQAESGLQVVLRQPILALLMSSSGNDDSNKNVTVGKLALSYSYLSYCRVVSQLLLQNEAKVCVLHELIASTMNILQQKSRNCIKSQKIASKVKKLTFSQKTRNLEIWISQQPHIVIQIEWCHWIGNPFFYLSPEAYINPIKRT